MLGLSLKKRTLYLLVKEFIGPRILLILTAVITLPFFLSHEQDLIKLPSNLAASLRLTTVFYSKNILVTEAICSQGLKNFCCLPTPFPNTDEITQWSYNHTLLSPTCLSSGWGWEFPGTLSTSFIVTVSVCLWVCYPSYSVCFYLERETFKY